MPQLLPPLQSTTLFGVRVDVGSAAQATEQILAAARARQGGLVCVANVDMLTRAKHSSKLMAIMSAATAVVTDGMPLVWALRRLRGRSEAARIHGPSLVLALCERASVEGISVYFYGGTQEEARLLRQALLARWPRLQLAGVVSPHMLPAEPGLDHATIETINDSGAGLLFVGLGCPKQEYWMSAQQPHLRPVSLGVGLAFALIAGTKSPAPNWMRDAGLEWLYRLGQEPGRLWKRYLVGNSRFIWYTVCELFSPGKQ